MATRGGWVVFCGHLLGLLKASEPSRQSAGRTRLLAGGVDVKATEQSCLLGSSSSRLVQKGPRVGGWPTFEPCRRSLPSRGTALITMELAALILILAAGKIFKNTMLFRAH